MMSRDEAITWLAAFDARVVQALGPSQGVPTLRTLGTTIGQLLRAGLSVTDLQQVVAVLAIALKLIEGVGDADR